MTTTTSRSTPRRSVAALASFLLLLSACGSSTSDGAGSGTDGDGTTETTDGTASAEATVSAEEGAASRQAQQSALGAAGAAGKERLTSDIAIDCGAGGEVYEPTAEEIATSNADTDALAAALDAAGIATTSSTDDYGFKVLEWDYDNEEAQNVVNAFWIERYPPEPLPAEEIARIKAENDLLAAALDGAGATYTRQQDASGAEWLEWDYENPEAIAAVEAVYAELYPVMPPTEEELAESRRQTDQMAAAFEAAGIEFTRVSDELGWEWLEWDYEDPEASAVAEQVWAELYPVDPNFDPCALAE